MSDSSRPAEAEAIEVERYELSERLPYRFELERRDFLRVVGGGLVVVSAIPSLFAQESGRGRAPGRGEAAELAAWLHVDEQGHVTGYTGKTEIGQNIRTSLAQAIADELRVGLEAVTLVMADTDLVPYDAGTFGSQSTPRMGRQLSRAAATAREMLIDQAAARWQVDRAALTARAGQDRGPWRPFAVVRRTDEGAEAGRIGGAGTGRHAGRRMDGPRARREESRRPRVRDRTPRILAGRHPPGPAARARDPPRQLRGGARVGR